MTAAPASVRADVLAMYQRLRPATVLDRRISAFRATRDVYASVIAEQAAAGCVPTEHSVAAYRVAAAICERWQVRVYPTQDAA